MVADIIRKGFASNGIIAKYIGIVLFVHVPVVIVIVVRAGTPVQYAVQQIFHIVLVHGVPVCQPIVPVAVIIVGVLGVASISAAQVQIIKISGQVPVDLVVVIHAYVGVALPTVVDTYNDTVEAISILIIDHVADPKIIFPIHRFVIQVSKDFVTDLISKASGARVSAENVRFILVVQIPTLAVLVISVVLQVIQNVLHVGLCGILAVGEHVVGLGHIQVAGIDGVIPVQVVPVHVVLPGDPAAGVAGDIGEAVLVCLAHHAVLAAAVEGDHVAQPQVGGVVDLVGGHAAEDLVADHVGKALAAGAHAQTLGGVGGVHVPLVIVGVAGPHVVDQVGHVLLGGHQAVGEPVGVGVGGGGDRGLFVVQPAQHHGGLGPGGGGAAVEVAVLIPGE